MENRGKRIMVEFNLNTFRTQVKQVLNNFQNNDIKSIDKENFIKNTQLDNSIFKLLDQNDDGKISEDEINTVLQADSDNNGIVTEKELQCMQRMKFLARRNVDKWFTLDINRDGKWSNVETKLGDKHMFGKQSASDTSLDGGMTNEQLAKLYNMDEVIDESLTMEQWMNGCMDHLQEVAKDQFNVDLNDYQLIILKKEMIKQLNTWLLKQGDNANGNAPLYNSLNCTAYTRLITTEQTVSCCGGDIVPPPAAENKNSCSFVFSDLERSEDSNTANEVKNRLAWAMFKTPPKEELAENPQGTLWENMTDVQYAKYHNQYQSMRNMSANDFRELLKPENEARRIEVEKNSAMSIRQIVQYIDIVESEIGEGNFDKEDWSVNGAQYQIITQKINGTFGDEERIQGKTRADIPENRQDLLRFLEEKGWLYNQFR